MSDEFIAKIDVEVEDSQLNELQQKLKTIEKNKIKLDVEVDSKDEVAKLAKSIESGLKNTKVNTSDMAKSLADSFNIDDKSIIRKMKSQINNMISNLSSTWNGKDFDLSKASGFYSGMENLGKLVADNAKIIESKMGIYDKFYDYAKNKKLFVSDDLKKALDGDEYKELLKNNVGKIVKDASKGISIDSIWGELSESFPEHFSENITNQADQLRRYFEVLKAAREDITKVIPASEMKPQQFNDVSDSAYKQVIEMATQMRSTLGKNILSASESEKTTLDLNVDINTDKIISDIRNALSGVTSSVDDALNINLKMNDEEIASQIRSAISKLDSDNEPVEINIKINRESLQTDINMALNELDLPIHFNIDAAELESDIRQAVNNITDIEIDLRVNTANLDVGITDVVTQGTDPLDEVRERAKKNPIEVGYKADNTSISNLVNTADRVFDLFTGTTALDFSGDKIRQAISDLKDLNSTLVEIDKTGNLTNQQLTDLADNSFDSASIWGALVQDYLSSSETFAQAGFTNLEEMSDLSTMAQMAGQMTEETATKFLISSDAAWQMKGNVKQLTSVLDGMNEITNKNALEMTDLANGIRVAGSMLANSGLAEDQAAALIGTGVATTKSSGEEVARGVRTIIMNLRQIKGETEDGELIDDESLKKVEQTCKDVGVSLKTVKNGVVELRNPIDILRELSEVYNSLDTMDARRAQITDDIAGKHRSNILSSILTNFDQYDKMIQDYASGEGSAFEEAMKTSESWEGRLNSLKNQWTEFVDGFVNADMMTAGVSGLENMVVAMDKLNDAQLFIPTMISSIMGLRNVFTGKGLTDISISQDGTGSLGKLDLQGNLFGIDFTKMGEWKSHFAEAGSALEDWNQGVLNGNNNLKFFQTSLSKNDEEFRNYLSTVQDGTASLEDYKKYLKETGEYQQKFSLGSIKSVLANAATGFIAGAAIELGVAAITKTIDYIAHADDRVREAAETARSGWESAQSDIESTNSELETTQQRINELKAKGSLSLVEEQELADLQRQNAELERTLNLQKDIEEYKHNEAKNAAKDSLEAEKKYEFNTDENGYYADVKRKVTTQEAVDKYISEIERMQEEQAALKEEMYNLNPKDDNFEFDYENYQQQIEDYESTIGETKEKLSEAYNELNTDISLFYDETTGKIDAGMEDQVNAFLASQKKMDNVLGNSAQSKESAINTLFAKKQFSGLEESFTEAANTGEEAIESLIKETPGLSDALDKAGISVDEFKEHFMALANPDALNFDEVKKQLKDAYSDVLDDEPTPADLKKSDYRNLEMDKFLKDKSDEEIEIFYKYINNGDIDLSELTLEDIQELFIKVTADTEEAESSYDTLIAKASAWLSTIDSVNAALVNSVSGSGLTATIDEETGTLTGNVADILNAYKDLDGFDASALFEKTANGIHVNLDALRLLQAQEEANNKTEFLETRKALLQELAEEQNKLNAITDTSSADYTNQQSIIANLQNQLQTVEMLSSAYDGATSAYQKWINAQSGGEEGDMYRSVSETMRKRGKELYEEGRVNTNEFRAIAQFYSNKDLSTASVEEVTKAYEKASKSIKKYFTGDKTGIDAFVADMKKLSDKENLGWVEELKDGSLKFNTGSDEEIANKLGISKEAVQSLYRAMSEYIDGIQIGDTSGVDNLSEQLETAKQKAKEAQEALKTTMDSMSGDNKIDLSFDIDAIDSVDELQAKIKDLQDYQSTLPVDSSEYEQAQTIIDGCEARIQELNSTPVSISVDISDEAGIANLKEQISSIPEGKSANISVSVHNEEQLTNAITEIEQIPPDTNANVTVNVSNQEEADALSAKIEELNSNSGGSITYSLNIEDNTGNKLNQDVKGATKTITVNEIQGTKVEVKDETKTVTVNEVQGDKVSVKDDNATITYTKDSSSVDNYKAPEKSGKVKYTVDSSSVNSWKAPAKTGSLVYKISTTGELPGDKTRSLTYNIKVNGSVPKVDGSAHVNGTVPYIKSSKFNDGYLGNAHASGDWSLKQNETALTGELGREIVVRNGKFFTVGDNGAEFANLKRGDIVFNHRQTEELLSKGYVTGRGKLIGGNAHVEGTAYSAGSGGWTQGKTVGGSGSKAYSSSSSNKSTKSTNKNTSAVNKNTAATNNNTSATEDIKDWIEVELNRLTHSLDEFTNLAGNYYSGWTKQNDQLNKAISQTQTNIKANEQAYFRYMQQANSVGLSGDYQQKVQTGQIDIQTITDENLKKQIEDYTQWYEAAQDCRDTIIDLNAQVKELGIQKIDNIIEDHDSFAGVIESIRDNYEAANKLLESQGKSASVSNLTVMAEQMNNAAAYRRGELKFLREEEENLLRSGAIAKWSQEWYELEGKIHDVEAEISNAAAEVYELRQQIREVNWKGFTDGIEAIDALNDNLENTLSLIDDMESFGQDDSLLSTTGITKLGLYGKQLGNARQAVADYEYAIETLNEELKIGNLTQEQYDEQLKELNEGRWEAVSSVKKYRDSILDLVKDGLNKETEATQKLVTAQKDSLDRQKEYYDWNKKVNDARKDINSINAQIMALQGDDSLEAQQKIRKLESQKKELEDQLAEEQRDREYDIVSQGYDDFMDKFEQNQEDALYELNSSLDAQNQAIQNMLDKAAGSYQTVYDELGALADVYGITLTEDLTEPWKSAESALESYKKAVEKLQADITINTNGVPGVSKNVSGVYYAESSPSVPDNNVQQQYQAQQAAAAAQQQQSSTLGYVSGIKATLQQGSTGNDVRKLQTALNNLGYNAGSVDGIFGSNTRAAVIRFQKASGIAADGVVGANTKAKFRARGYEKGTKHAKPGLALIDDVNGELKLGSEIVVTNTGVLRQMKGGEYVFDRERVQRLWEMSEGKSSDSSLPAPYNWNSDTPITSGASQNVANMIQPRNVGGGDTVNYNLHYDTLMTVNGNVTDKQFVENLCKKSFDYTARELKKYKKRI